MLDWLSGASRASDGAETEPEHSVEYFDDAPTTPAPIFAARAFKHLIWGTPQPEDVDRLRERPRRRISRAPRNQQSDTGVASTARTEAGCQRDQLPALSPAKRPGILVTPGTGGTRRKTVSFEKKPPILQFGATVAAEVIPTPRDVPGKFPTPGLSTIAAAGEKEQRPLPIQSLADACEDIRQVPVAKNLKPGHRKESLEDVTVDMAAPRSTSGRYWQSEFNSYSSKSTLEMRKLAKKEQLAKKYAKHKDSEAMKLAEALRREQKKVAELEKHVEDYVARLSLAVHGHPSDTSKRRKDAEQSSSKSSPPRSELRRMESLLTDANARAETLQQSNAKHASKVSRLECERRDTHEMLARLKEENRALRAQLSTQPPPQQSKEPNHVKPDAAELDLGSDIWADVGDNHNDALRSARKSGQGSRKSPLRQRDLNVADEVKLGKSTKEQVLTDERREAAMRRLEERRRARERGGMGVTQL